MKRRRYLQCGLGMLLILIIGCVTVTPAHSAHAATQQARSIQASTPLNAKIYLATGTLAPIFQSTINQQVPNVVTGAINAIVSKLPSIDQGWATTMATTLIQPSATLTSLTPQQGGLAATLRLSLYPGDPQPTNASMLITFTVLNSNTVQVNVKPLPGSPTLISGPVITLHIPFGQLNSLSATPSCGNQALAVNLQVPVSLGQASTQGASSATTSGLGDIQIPQTQRMPRANAGLGNVNAYVEIPSASLASLGNSITSLPISNNLTAQNIQLSVQGGNIVINSDIMLGGSLQLGTAVTTVAPQASNGSLSVNVLSTKLTIFQIFTFPENTYNAQIQQTLNSQLGGALTGKFNVTGAAIGANSNVPCAASDSLILTGTANLG
ncbi:MAG TPA: hypothetical protein DHW02_15195 [Ktedonobacter sp.]|nr:hypothetical protein [Ktedonobacter sp.]